MAFTNIGLDAGAAQKEKVAPPRFGKKPDALVVAVGKGGPPPDAEGPNDPNEPDADDSGSGDYAADLAKVGEKYGAAPDTSTAMAADFMEALAKCMRGKSAGPQMPPMEGGQ